MNEGTWNSLSIHINKQSILWLLPVITVLSRRIQGKGATAALKIIIKFSAILLRTKFTRDQPVFNSIIEFTCLLIKGGRNSNKADAHGVSWEDILSTSTPCLSKPWISWGTKRYWKELSKEREIVMLICNSNDNNCYFLMVQQSTMYTWLTNFIMLCAQMGLDNWEREYLQEGIHFRNTLYQPFWKENDSMVFVWTKQRNVILDLNKHTHTHKRESNSDSSNLALL